MEGKREADGIERENKCNVENEKESNRFNDYNRKDVRKKYVCDVTKLRPTKPSSKSAILPFRDLCIANYSSSAKILCVRCAKDIPIKLSIIFVIWPE